MIINTNAVLLVMINNMTDQMYCMTLTLPQHFFYASSKILNNFLVEKTKYAYYKKRMCIQVILCINCIVNVF